MTQTETLSLECYKCGNCGNVTLSVKRVCPKCYSTKIEKTQSDGKGKVVDFTTVYYPPDNYKDMCPYTSVLVQLNNGCKLFGVMEGEVKNISPGSPVALAKHDAATGRLIFRLS